MSSVADLVYERECLKAELARLRATVKALSIARQDDQAELARLREALKEIAEYARAVGMPHIADVARNALKGDA